MDCVEPSAPVVPCVVCNNPVHTCERAQSVNGSYACPAHPNGAEVTPGVWVCSTDCYDKHDQHPAFVGKSHINRFFNVVSVSMSMSPPSDFLSREFPIYLDVEPGWCICEHDEWPNDPRITDGMALETNNDDGNNDREEFDPGKHEDDPDVVAARWNEANPCFQLVKIPDGADDPDCYRWYLTKRDPLEALARTGDEP